MQSARPVISLSRPELRRSLLSEDGKEYSINPDFRLVLRCVEVVSDPDKTDLAKALFVAQNMFLGNPPPDMWAVFSAFVAGEQRGEPSEEQLVDFEQDAGAIYSSFREQYGIDLLRAKLHWDEFRTLLAGLGAETAFGRLVAWRATDLNDVPEGQRQRLRRLKDMVAITPRMSRREAELQAELDRRLAAGEDPAEIIRQLKGV